MSMLPKGDTTTTTAEGGAGDPKGATGASGTAAPPAATATPPSGQPARGGSSEITATGTASGTSATAPSAGGTGTAGDPRADYERKLASLADLEFSVKKQKDDVDARAGRVAALEKIADALPEGVTAELLTDALSKLKAGEEAGFLKTLLRERWSADALIRWADAFDAEELTVEQRVERKLAAERKAEADRKADEERRAREADEARRKKADDDAVADAGRQLDEQTKSASKWLAENVSRYPLIAALDDDEDVDHVQMFRDRVIDWVEKHDNRLPTNDEGLAAMRTEIFDAIEARHRRQRDRLVPPPRDLRKEQSEWDRTELVRLKNEEAAAVAPPPRTGPLTGHEEALARIRQQDREDAERAALSYGRR